MKKNKLLSALVIGGLAGALSLGATNPANATSHIHIDSTGGGEGSGDNWYYTDCYSSGTTLYTEDTGKTFTKWIGDEIEDNVVLEGGRLETNHSGNNGTIQASSGNLSVNTGTLHLNSDSSIANEVNLAVNGTLDLQNGSSAYLGGTSDSWSGTLNNAGGTLTLDDVTKGGILTQTSGTTNIYQDLTLNSNTEPSLADSVTAGTLKIGDSATSNAGTLTTNIDLSTDVTKNIESNGSLIVNNGTTVLDDGDTWNGTLSNTGGSITLNGVAKNGIFTQTSGNSTTNINQDLTLNSNTEPSLADSVTNGILLIYTDASLTTNIDLSADVIKGFITSSLIVNDGTTVLDSDDFWWGTLSNTGGTITLNGVSQVGNFTQTSGNGTTNIYQNLTLNSNTDPSLADSVTTGTLKIGDSDTSNPGTLTTNIDLSADVTKDIQSNGSLIVNNGTTVLDSGDTWNGEITLSGGTLNLKDRTGTAADITNTSDGNNKTFTQTAGTLTLQNSSLSLHDTTSQIKDGTSTYSTVNLNSGSALTFDNGTTNANAAVIKTDSNANNSLTVGGDNGAKLTLKSGNTTETNSDISAGTAITVTGNGDLTTYGTSIKGDGSKGITNDGTYNLSNNGDTAGTLARELSGAGTINLTGTTLSTSDDTSLGTTAATITQNNVTVGDGSGDAGSDKSVFTMGADVTANTLLTVNQDGKIENAASDISAQVIEVGAGGKITGVISDTNVSYGDITVNNGGSNAGIIEQNDVTLNVVAAETPATFDNIGTLTANGTFTNNIQITDSSTAGKLNINNGGTSSGAITQNEVTVTNNNAFNNNANLTATKSLTNNGIINNSSKIDVKNATPTTTPANLLNTGTINSTAGSTITADTLTNHISSTTSTSNGTINLTKSKLAIVYQADDIKGVINTLGTSASTDTSELSIKGTNPNFAGALNVGKAADPNVKSALSLTSGNVVENANVNIATGNVMNVNGADATLVLDNGDSELLPPRAADVYKGDLNLVSGKVKMKDLDITADKISTTDTSYQGTKPYYTQNGGELTLENSTLSMTNSGLITGGDMIVDGDSTYNSLSNAFSLNKLTNGGTINGINKGYENYSVSNSILVGDGTNANTVGDFTSDLYARSNYQKNHDSYGKDNNTILGATNEEKGIFNISDWKLNGDIYGWDAPMDRQIKMDGFFKGHVAENQEINFTSTNKEVLTPIGWYGLHSTGAGDYSFNLSRYNPKVFRGQVTKIAQYQNQLAINDMLFNHTMLDQGFKGNDYIASHPNRYASANDLYAPYQYSREEGGVWVKMYGTFEKLQMNQGFKVENNAYGAIIGADLGLQDLRNGWQFMPTAYVAYNGAHQNFGGTGAYQNGGQVGFLGTWYKNDFMIGALAYGGVYGNDMDTPRGNDQTFGYFAGGSAKAAYNWRFAKDWSLQPNLLVAYNFFGQENWHTNFGQMGMMSGALNGVNLAPGVNLIWEKETFSIYGTLQYMYNLNQSVGGRAGNVGLPHVYMNRGYIQYGIGFNKRFTDRFSGYLQAVIRNIGRNGIGLQGGFQWQLGKTSSNYYTPQKDVTPELKKAEITLNGKKIQ